MEIIYEEGELLLIFVDGWNLFFLLFVVVLVK